MKKIILIIAILYSNRIYCQNHNVGIKIGSSITNVTKQRFVSSTDNRFGLNFCFTYEHLSKKYFSIGTEIVYNQKGFRTDNNFTDDKGNPIGKKSTTKFNYDYITVPIKVGLNYGNKLYGFTNIAIAASKLIDAKTIVPVINSDLEVIGTQTSNLTKYVRKFDIGGNVEFGIGLKFRNKFRVFTSFAYQHSFIPFSNSKYFSNSNLLHNGKVFSIGLNYKLIRKEKSNVKK